MSAQPQVWVTYVDVGQQYLIAVVYNEGMTARDAIELSQIRNQVSLPKPLQIGIFGVKITPETRLQAGDRVEIYRALTIHPQDIRRKRAEKNPVGRYLKSNRSRQSDS